MCGICGIYGLERIDAPERVLRRMNDALAHRGPDADGEFLTNEVALGHRRLSIIDLTDSANQPMHSTNKDVTVVFNGELYNYRSLKAELTNYNYQTNSDTEVVLAAFLEWGIEAVGRFDGMFALALWDNRTKELFLVRDRLGIKPLYVAQTENSFLFSSELRSLLASGLVQRRLDHSALVDFMHYQTVHAPQTLIVGVEMMMPGTILQISDNEQKVHRYWQIADNVNHKASDQSTEEIKHEVAKLTESAVQKRLMADVPFGAFLSGGIDSSLIVGLMAKNLGQPVKTFSVTFNEDKFSEAPYARRIAEKFATDHTEIRLSPEDFLKDLPNALSAMDHPSGDGPNTYVVSRVTKEAGVTMALSGTGGDELFCGYDIFKRFLALQDRKWLLSFQPWLRGLGGWVLKNMKPGMASEKTAAVLKAGYFDIEHVYWVSRLLFFDKRIATLLEYDDQPRNRVFEIVGDQLGYGKPGFNLPKLSHVSIAEISTYLQNTLLRDTDQMSMAHALEVRVPFLDHHLIEYVLGIPDTVKYPHSPKQLLVESHGDMLPREIVDRQKMGFTFPWNEWLKGTLRTYTRDHLSDLGKRDIFRSQGIDRLWKQFESGHHSVNWAHIWNLVVLENWMRENQVDV